MNKIETVKNKSSGGKVLEGLISTHVHIPCLNSVKGPQSDWGFSVHSADIMAHVCCLRAGLTVLWPI